MSTVETSRPNATSARMDRGSSSRQASDPSTRTAVSAGVAKAQAAVSVEIGDAAPVQQSGIAALMAEAEREYEAIIKSLGMMSSPNIRIVVTRAFEGSEVEISQSYPDSLLILIPPHIIERRHLISSSGESYRWLMN
ncbi:MAG: hypothetical protein HYX38_11250 [Rhodospirillales bacterium]|nr:hypothetical protein [Rhodospirillales bacterium]